MAVRRTAWLPRRSRFPSRSRPHPNPPPQAGEGTRFSDGLKTQKAA
ncbi:hypothetical protein HMPREF9123_1284 [Neisseria bacilliformis ATCC BAA-1200]|uniref:Uncharacterized protein n=1 Tax=Neisseria bacilliformis ATCC BAA-1200 TaxID=888742 RepID=F2BC29_9NEIS|nr:hypothetical protein HMPREF9123_1284 [Neisseria bacilliformis ATCC BAA-1200]